MSSLKNYVVPSLGGLAEEFSLIRSSSFLGIPGVIIFDSGIPGPCLGITIQTHGNEPSGLAALRYFRKENLTQNLLKGSVIFVLNNIEASERYFETFKISDSDERSKAKLKARFCDVNMNRLPMDTLRLSGNFRSEIVRAQKLAPVWKRFDVGLDIHTMRNTTDPMIVALGDVKSDLYRGFSVNNIIRNIENVQTGKPAAAFYGESGVTPVFGIEAGLHEEASSFELAVVCVLKLLQNIDMLDGESEATKKIYKEYWVNSSIFFPNESYELSKEFKGYEQVEAGQIIALGDGDPIRVQSAGHIVFGPLGRKPTAPLTDEVLFLSAPMKLIEI